MEMSAQSTGQGMGGFRIAFQYNNTCTHKSPLNRRQRRIRAVGKGWENHDSTDIMISKSRREKPTRYLRAGAFSITGSNGSAWSFPFFFSRISTLPSACSSSLRQADE